MGDPPFNSVSHLDRLLDGRNGFVVAAQQLPTPNAEDDELVRCGMIGFAEHASLDRWDRDCFEYVRASRDDVLGDDFSPSWRRFTCLAAGYFLGMRVAGFLSDIDHQLADAHTPGYMWLHAESFDPRTDGDQDAGQPAAAAL